MPVSHPTPEPRRGGYEPDYFERLFAVEDRHFWFRSRNRAIEAVVRRTVRHLPAGYRALEVGCGTGNVLRVLERVCPHGVVVGLDLFAEGLRFARTRTASHLVAGDVSAPPFGVSFDLIGLFDVLEHLPDDEAVLERLRALLSPGGTLLLTVPAHPWLWSYFDDASRHCRRYEPSVLRDRLVRAGYRVEYLTQYMAGILPLVWAGRRLAALLAGLRPIGSRHHDVLAAGDLRVTRGANTLLAWLLSWEAAALARGVSLPLGSSLLAVAKRESWT